MNNDFQSCQNITHTAKCGYSTKIHALIEIISAHPLLPCVFLDYNTNIFAFSNVCYIQVTINIGKDPEHIINLSFSHNGFQIND